MGLLDDALKINTGYAFQNVGNNVISLIPESDFERNQMKEIEKAVLNKINALSKKHPDKINNPSSKIIRDTNTLKKGISEFLDEKSINSTDKVMIKYRQAAEYLIIYFNETCLINNITSKEGHEFRTFLSKVPKNFKGRKELKGKNIKVLIDSKSKLLDSFEKQEFRTIDEIVVKCKTIFENFVNKGFLPINPFVTVKKLGKKGETTKREFKEEELKRLFNYFKNNNLLEEYNFFLLSLYFGTRRGELLSLFVEDVDLEKGYIEILGRLKTVYSKRVIPIHKDILPVMADLLKNKAKNDYLIFTDIKVKSRDEKIGTLINSYILDILGEEDKKSLDIHSLRKNFAQTVFLSNEFNDLNLKTIIGHSTKTDITDLHYLKGKRDYKSLKDSMDKVDFSIYF